jgi:hypothetical protein
MRLRRASAPVRSCASAWSGRAASAGHRPAGRRGVGGVGLDQHLGLVAARHAAAEVAGMVTANWASPVRSSVSSSAGVRAWATKSK